MSLVYSLISCNSMILTEYPGPGCDDVAANARKIAHHILKEKVPKELYARNRSYGLQKYIGHYKIDNLGICYMVMVYTANIDDTQVVRSYKFIEDITSHFLSLHVTNHHIANPQHINDTFSLILQQKLQLWNDPNADLSTKVKNQTASIKDKLINTFKIFDDRQQQLDETERRLLDLQKDANEFNTTAHQLQNTLWWQDRKCKIILAITSIGLILIIALLVVFVINMQFD